MIAWAGTTVHLKSDTKAGGDSPVGQARAGPIIWS